MARLLFAVGEGELDLPGRDGGQDHRFLAFRPGQFHGGRAEYDRGEEGFERHHAAEFLHHQHHIDGAAAEAAVFFVDRQAEQAEFGILVPQLAAPAMGLGHVGAALREAVIVRQEARNAVFQQALVFREFKIHYSPNTALVRIFFWISLVPP